jgi:hypothetical protein
VRDACMDLILRWVFPTKLGSCTRHHAATAASAVTPDRASFPDLGPPPITSGAGMGFGFGLSVRCGTTTLLSLGTGGGGGFGSAGYVYS